MVKSFYFDTYAIIEIRKGNPNYKPYEKDVKIILNNLNLMELVFYLLKNEKENEIKEVVSALSSNNVEYDNGLLIEAAKMKFKFQKERLSFIDCIGYCLAKKHNVKFLTGDEKFRDKDNIEFIK